jgi:hypothetical protein
MPESHITDHNISRLVIKHDFFLHFLLGNISSFSLLVKEENNVISMIISGTIIIAHDIANMQLFF